MYEEARSTRDKAKERFRPIESAFGNLHPDDTAFFLDFIDATRQRDSARLAQLGPIMRGLLDTVSPAQQAAIEQAVTGADPGGGDGFDPYDPAQVDARIEAKARELLAAQRAEDDERRQIDDARTEMATKAKALADHHGLPELGDPSTDLGRLLYIKANHDYRDETDALARLEKAADAIVDELGKRAQALLKAKTTDAGPSPAPTDAAAPTGQNRPATFDEADQAALARIDALRRGPMGN